MIFEMMEHGRQKEKEKGKRLQRVPKIAELLRTRKKSLKNRVKQNKLADVSSAMAAVYEWDFVFVSLLFSLSLSFLVFN